MAVPRVPSGDWFHEISASSGITFFILRATTPPVVEYAATPDGDLDLDAWHDLRKAIKRFRYLVAAFAPMYPDSAFEQVPRRLADLQDTLGRLQDHHVQAAWIETIGVSAGGRAALAAGVVANTLHERSDRAHDHCREAWSEFDRPKLRRRLRVLLTA